MCLSNLLFWFLNLPNPFCAAVDLHLNTHVFLSTLSTLIRFFLGRNVFLEFDSSTSSFSFNPVNPSSDQMDLTPKTEGVDLGK